MSYEIIRLSNHDDSWEHFETDWRQRCNDYDEEFDNYAEGTFAVVRDLIDEELEKAGAFSFRVNGSHISMCQINVTGLPGYDSPVMRVRHLTLSPDYDFGEKSVEEYADVLVNTFSGILALSDISGPMNVKYINFHLRSLADRQFFAYLGAGLDSSDEFSSVKIRGSWLYITKS